jgi:prepilin-type N-terminal cleavage/methylation domain-containing protein
MYASDALLERLSPTALARGTRPRAFTLIELVVVISVVALLVTILLPSMGLTFELAYATMCRSNLQKLGQAMQGGSMQTPLSVPTGSAWTSAAVSYGSKDLLLCPKDDEEPEVTMDSLEDYYLLQSHGGGNTWWVSNVAAILGVGEGVIQDRQIYRDEDIPPAPVPHHGNHPCWCYVPVRKENQKLISITDEGTILITFEAMRIRIDSIVGCGVTHCGSDHWLMKGHCTDGARSLQEDEVIMRLGGNSYREVDPNSPYYIEVASTASYGINELIESKRFGPQQLMLMDARAVVIPVGEAAWMECVADRHLGKVNVVTAGGNVRAITKAELQDEYLLYELEGPDSRSLWGHRACPRDKH